MEPNKNRRNLLLAILAFAVIAGAILVIVLVRREGGFGAPAAGGDDLDDLSGALDAVPDVSTLVTPTDPLENLPDVNPAAQANPFRGVNTNPFR